MYNLRYHIASLVAVFLALSVGLVLGTVVVERGIFDRQRESIVQSLQEQFDSLGAENKELTAALAQRDRFVESLVDVAVANTLEGETILVLVSSGRADGFGDVRDAITQAGGAAVTFVLTEPSLGLEN
ncbi:MAG: copper transporter, partial [Coriobacteriia bacterium]|nr:copper transporter [Coriobacteriia bacterium]